MPSLSTVHCGTWLTALQSHDKHSTALSVGYGTSHAFSNDNAQWNFPWPFENCNSHSDICRKPWDILNALSSSLSYISKNAIVTAQVTPSVMTTHNGIFLDLLKTATVTQIPTENLVIILIVLSSSLPYILKNAIVTALVTPSVMTTHNFSSPF